MTESKTFQNLTFIFFVSFYPIYPLSFTPVTLTLPLFHFAPHLYRGG